MTIDLGQRIRARRTLLNIRQKDLAALTGLSVSYVSLVEHGDRIPHLATIQKFASALQTTASALVSNDVVADATKASDSVESLVSYLLARNASDEQVRRVEALARVLLEVDQGVRVPAVPLPPEKKAKALEAISALRKRTEKPPDWCWLCRGDPAAQCPECGAPPVPISYVLPAAKVDDAEAQAWVSSFDPAKEGP